MEISNFGHVDRSGFFMDRSVFLEGPTGPDWSSLVLTGPYWVLSWLRGYYWLGYARGIKRSLLKV